MKNALLGYLVMTKPRAIAVVLVTTAAGLLLATEGALDWVLMVHLLIGAGLEGCGSIVLNQVMERDHDRKMERTKDRPLPRGIITPRAALIYGIALSLVGTAWLAIFVNQLTAALGLLCVLSYVLFYTPLKRHSVLNTAVGAIPGAIPPMMGWTALRAEIGYEAWALFAILFVWQFPHFLAIAWLYKEDYERAGYCMLSRFDSDGRMTGRQMIINSALLVVVSLIPTRLGFAGMTYFYGALVLGLGMLGFGVAFRVLRTKNMATWVLRASVAYMSILMTLLIVDKIS